MGCIATSVFDLFKIGPGPSSSHTLGPMKAGYEFIQAVKELAADVVAKATRIEVRLYGSLSATGKGHGTHKAVLAGLLGQSPETCPPSFLDDLENAPEKSYDVALGAGTVTTGLRQVIFDSVTRELEYSNTLNIKLMSGDIPLFEREYHSIGGGFIHWDGQPAPQREAPRYEYETADELEELLTQHKMRLHELILANEMAMTGDSEQEVWRKLDVIMEHMDDAVSRGLEAEGLLPGKIKLQRKAKTIHERRCESSNKPDRFLIALNAYAFAASEENAAGHIIVTAPTSGAAGVIPAVLRTMKQHMGVSRENRRKGMLAAAAVGFLAKHNASIAGAEVGCQGEVGVASSMAAALLAYAGEHRYGVTFNAAEIALEHHLGMTCDPVDGYVQIPCIERNAMGAVKAYNAYLVGATEYPFWHMVGLDKAIQVMAETGRDMSSKYKETALGGLATAEIEC